MSRFFKRLESAGILNTNSEDLGTLSTGQKMSYKYYCSSVKCAGITKNEIYKFTTTDWVVKCKDCGHTLHSKRVKK